MYNNNDFIIKHDEISCISSFCISVCTDMVFALCFAYGVSYVSDVQVHRAQELEGQRVRRNVSSLRLRWTRHVDISFTLGLTSHRHLSFGFVMSGPVFRYSMLSIVFSNLSNHIVWAS